MTATTGSRGSVRVAPGFTPVDTARDDVALVAFTSGTTGQPKGCVHYHRDILAPADSFARHVLKPRPGDRWACSAPIAFTFGLGMLLIFPWRFGGTAVTIETPGPKPLLDAIARHEVTTLATAPTAYKAMIPLLREHDISSLRTCVSAGEHLPAATWQAWRDATGIGIVDGIGATEMMHIFISAAGEDIRPGSTGKAVPGYVATVLDEDDRPLESGTGRLAVKGPTGCRYFDDDRQANYVIEGWNVTGDTYRRDEEGYFWYLARSDDMIISSGYNIAAPEVENALLAHPAVQDCAVIGAPCDERGQKVKAFVVLASRLRGRRGHRGGAAGSCEGGDRSVQISARDRLRRDAAEDRDRQAPALRAARLRLSHFTGQLALFGPADVDAPRLGPDQDQDDQQPTPNMRPPGEADLRIAIAGRGIERRRLLGIEHERLHVAWPLDEGDQARLEISVERHAEQADLAIGEPRLQGLPPF